MEKSSLKVMALAIVMVLFSAAGAFAQQKTDGTWVLTDTEAFTPKGTRTKRDSSSWHSTARITVLDDGTIVSYVFLQRDKDPNVPKASSVEAYHECTPPKGSYKPGEEVELTMYAYEKHVSGINGGMSTCKLVSENKTADNVKKGRWACGDNLLADFRESGYRGGWLYSKDNKRITVTAKLPTKAAYGDRIAILFEDSTGRDSMGGGPQYEYAGESWYAWIFTYQAPGSAASTCDFGLDVGEYINLLSGTWQSSDPSVIKINKKGRATAVGEGTATLTSSSGKKLVIKVVEE